MARNNLLLQELQRSYPNTTEFDPDFHQVMVDHFSYIRKNPAWMTSFTPEALQAAIYKGDFHGLLLANNVLPPLHNILTEFNGFTKSSDFDGSVRTFWKIEAEIVETLKNAFQTKRR